MSHLGSRFPQRVHSWFDWHGSWASAGGECCGDVSSLEGGHRRLCGGEGKEGREEQTSVEKQQRETENGEVPLQNLWRERERKKVEDKKDRERGEGRRMFGLF